MQLISKKLVSRLHGSKAIGHYCLGCDDLHFILLTYKGKHCNFDFNLENPTFEGAFQQVWGETPEERRLCRYKIVQGSIRYFSACSHEYAGSSLNLSDVPQSIIEDYEISPFGEAIKWKTR